MDPRLDKNADYRRDLAQALDRQQDVRDYAIYGLRVNICGFDCLQFTPYHFGLLNCSKSPFIIGGKPTHADIALFLWVVSPGFNDSAPDRLAFTELVSLIDMDEAIQAIGDYLDDAFMDSPASHSGTSKVAATSFLASLVHEFAKTYGWTRETTLHTPLAALYQYLRRMTLDDNPKTPMHSRFTDRVKKNYADKIKAANG